MRGRKPKPTALKVLEGNPGKRRLNDAEPQFKRPERAPYAPRHLSQEARREWRRIAMPLIEAGVFTDVDQAVLALYCQAWGRWVKAERELQKDGQGWVLKSPQGGLYQNPWLAVANKAWTQVLKAATEFGMTPSSRSRVRVTVGDKEPSLAEQLFAMAEGVVLDGD